MSDDRETPIDRAGQNCPTPLKNYPNIILSHGGGGQLTADLVETIFLPAFQNEILASLGDSAVVQCPVGRVAVSTDVYVVQPLFFPGGSIGDLAINGTINDLAMSGARPSYLTAGFILEEGLPISQLRQIADDMGRAARRAGVAIVAGDTKVVERGHGDGCYIATAGIGVLDAGVDIGLQKAQPGDCVLINGTIGDHGMAVMSVREGLEFESPIRSDTAALNTLVQEMLQVCPGIRTLHDPTRGGLAMCLNEIARASGCGMIIDESRVSIDPPVQAACEILGLDPWMVANEGKLVAVVPEDFANEVLNAMKQNEFGAKAQIIGRVVSDRNRLVIIRTRIGATRVVPVPLGEQLPRIC